MYLLSQAQEGVGVPLLVATADTGIGSGMSAAINECASYSAK